MDRAKIVIGSDHRIQGVYRNQLIRFFVRGDICWIARLAGLSRYGKDFRWARGRYQCPLIDDDEDSRSNKATFEQQIALLFRLCDEELFIQLVKWGKPEANCCKSIITLLSLQLQVLQNDQKGTHLKRFP